MDLGQNLRYFVKMNNQKSFIENIKTNLFMKGNFKDIKYYLHLLTLIIVAIKRQLH
jgi:hypothetical protein